MDSERNISRLKLDLWEKHKLSKIFIENTINWLKKKVRCKTKLVKINCQENLNVYWTKKQNLKVRYQRDKEEEKKKKKKKKT